MKRIGLIAIALLAGGLVGFAGNDIISGKRIIATNGDKPAVVICADQTGAGDLAVFDHQGREVFAVHHGAIVSADLDRRIEARIAACAEKCIQDELKKQQAALVAATAPQAPPQPRPLKVTQPADLDRKPVVKVELVDVTKIESLSHSGSQSSSGVQTRWRLSLAVTNISRHTFSQMRLRAAVPPELSPQHDTDIKNFAPNESRDWTIELVAPGTTLDAAQTTVKLESASIRIK